MRPVLLVPALLLAATPLAAEPNAAPHIRIQRDSDKGVWGLESTNARLGDVAKALARSMACTITVDPKAAERRLDTVIMPRSPERLVPLLGRRANVSATLVYRFEMPRVGEAATSSPAGFGKDLVARDLREPLEIDEAIRSLGVPAELGKGVHGKVRVNSLRAPVHRVLDQIAAQTRSRWSVEIRLRDRTAADEIAAREEAPRLLYSDLARLNPEERREEIQADLEALENLPEEEQGEAVKTLAGNLKEMGSLVKEAQENRGAVAGNVSAIARDYSLALRRLPSDNRAWSAPLFDALRELSLELRALQ